MSGVVAIARGLFEHPAFAPEPFTEREAWQWMIAFAAWRETRARVGRSVIELKRGQLAYATRFLAEKWKWKSEGRVRRFLKRLKTASMIDVLATREATLITICNYDKWQFGRRTDEVENDAQTDAQATHRRRKEEEDNNLRKKDAADAAPDPEADLFRRGKQVLGQSAGGLIKQLLAAKDGKVNLARAAIEQAAGKENPREWIGKVIRNHDPPPGGSSSYVDGRL